MQRLLFILFIAGISTATRAEEAPAYAEEAPRAVTLDEALTYARAHQPRIKSAIARFEARQAEAQIPRAGWLPRVGAAVALIGASVNNTTSSLVGIHAAEATRVAGTPFVNGTNWTPYPTSFAGVTVDQEIWDFGRYEAQSAAADALAAVARYEAAVVALDVDYAVEEAFDGVLAAKEIVRATEDAWKRAVTHRDYAAAGVKSGLRPPVDLTRAEADVAQFDVRRIQVRSALDIARAGLAATMGSDQPMVDAAPVEPATSPAGANMPDSVKQAETHNPAIGAASEALHAQKEETRAIGAELLPNVAATGGLYGNAGGATFDQDQPAIGGGWLPTVGNWYAGLTLQWRLEPTVLARRRASEARERAREADVANVRSDVTYETQQAYIDLDAAVRALPGFQQAVVAAQANQAQADARFRAGLGTAVELADAEAVLTRAEVDLAIGRFNVTRARARLERAIGGPVANTR